MLKSQIITVALSIFPCSPPWHLLYLFWDCCKLHIPLGLLCPLEELIPVIVTDVCITNNSSMQWLKKQKSMMSYVYESEICRSLSWILLFQDLSWSVSQILVQLCQWSHVKSWLCYGTHFQVYTRGCWQTCPVNRWAFSRVCLMT